MRVFPLSLLALAGIGMSCSDSVDQSDMYTFVGETVTDYIAADSNFSMFYKVIQKSKVSQQSKSYLDALLSARGNYTCFVPDNDAMKTYLDSIYGSQVYDLDTMSESVANVIAQNCIIDRGNYDAYKTSDLTKGTISEGTLNDRHIMVDFDTLEGGKFTVVLNGTSHITDPDIEVENGMIHVVDRVIAPSAANLPSLLAEAGNMKIFSYLLSVTGIADSMVYYRDETYEEATDDEVKPTQYFTSSSYHRPEHRYYGYTAFVEPDSVYHDEWGIPMPEETNGVVTNWDEIVAAVKAKASEIYPNATASSLTSPDNAVNQFVTYHVMDYRVAYNDLTNHSTEYMYDNDFPDQLTVNTWDYYKASINGSFRMFKITQTTDAVYHINRHSYYNNAFNGDYKETSCDHEGLTISNSNGVYPNNALNGYYFPINHIMVYDDYVRDVVLNERIRYNLASNFTEMMTNNIRTSHNDRLHYYIPVRYPYVKTLTVTDADVDFRICAMSGSGWQGIQGNQFAFQGLYIVTFEMMPVPFDGTYEIRYGVSNLPERGLCQGYFGTDPSNLQAVGLPFDLRLYGTDSRIGSVLDVTLANDSALCIENDQQMRNHMYMKAPKYYSQNVNSGANNNPLRNRDRTLRLIVYRGEMKANTKYYFRFKTCLTNTSAYLFGSYFEIVPKSVWNNPLHNEDVW